MATPTPSAGVTHTDPLLTVQQAADYLTLSRAHTYRLLSEGQLRAVRLGRAVRARRSTLDTFIAEVEA